MPNYQRPWQPPITAYRRIMNTPGNWLSADDLVSAFGWDRHRAKQEIASIGVGSLVDKLEVIRWNYPREYNNMLRAAENRALLAEMKAAIGHGKVKIAPATRKQRVVSLPIPYTLAHAPATRPSLLKKDFIPCSSLYELNQMNGIAPTPAQDERQKRSVGA